MKCICQKNIMGTWDIQEFISGKTVATISEQEAVAITLKCPVFEWSNTTDPASRTHTKPLKKKK